MNIWIIDHYAVPEKYYPLIRQTIFARKLSEKGYSVRIFAASTVHNSDINLVADGSLYKEDYVDGVNYTYIRCHNYQGNGIKRILNMEEFAYKLNKVSKVYAKKGNKPDVVLACSMTLQACMKGIRIAKKYNARAIAQISDLWPETIVSYGKATKYNPAIWWLRAIEKWIYVKADKIIFTMEGAYDYILERKWEKIIPRSKISFINNGVDLEQFEYNREHYKVDDYDLLDKNTFKVVYTGSIRKVNNIGILLEIAKNVDDKDIRFLIWGDGDELNSIKERVKKDCISNVLIKGKVEKKYIPFIVSNADINIAHNSPSKMFRFGISFNKIFDYMAAGKPIIVDFPSYYNPVELTGSGICVNSNNPIDIANEIMKMKSMDKQKYVRYCEAAKNAAELYNFDNLTNHLLSVIDIDVKK